MSSVPWPTGPLRFNFSPVWYCGASSLPAFPSLSPPSPLSHRTADLFFLAMSFLVFPAWTSLLNPSALSGLSSVVFSKLLADFSLLFPTRNPPISSSQTHFPLSCPFPSAHSQHRSMHKLAHFCPCADNSPSGLPVLPLLTLFQSWLSSL